MNRREVIIGVAALVATPASAFNIISDEAMLLGPTTVAPVGNILTYGGMGPGGPMAICPTGTTRDANADFIMTNDM